MTRNWPLSLCYLVCMIVFILLFVPLSIPTPPCPHYCFQTPIFPLTLRAHSSIPFFTPSAQFSILSLTPSPLVCSFLQIFAPLISFLPFPTRSWPPFFLLGISSDAELTYESMICSYAVYFIPASFIFFAWNACITFPHHNMRFSAYLLSLCR